MIEGLVKDIKNGYSINKEEAAQLLKYELQILAKHADDLRKHFSENKFDLCCIVNGKSGKCSEDCKFCAQSSRHKTNIEVYPLLPKSEFVKDAQYNYNKKVKRYSIVTSGKSLTKREVREVCKAYLAIKEEVGIKTCASHGLLDEEDMINLKKVGVERYHNNLETSRKHFGNICTTHSFDEKIKTIKAAQDAGLEVCSGGILGIGESEEDRIDMAFELKDLNIKSIPLNMLNYIEGTNIGYVKKITEEDFLKAVAIFRFINPEAQIRLAGGRNLLTQFGKLAFKSGANATITGDMLTTCGSGIDEDLRMIDELGFEI